MPEPAGYHSRVFRNSLISLAFACVLTPSATVAETTNAPAASGVTSMRLQPLDNAASPAFMGVWEPYVDGNWLSFDLDFTNGPSAIELREARVRYRDAGGAEVASVTVGQADLAFATLSRGSAPGAFGKTGGRSATWVPTINAYTTWPSIPMTCFTRLAVASRRRSSRSWSSRLTGCSSRGTTEDGELDSAFAGNGKLRVDTSLPIPDGVDENEAPTVVADGANAIVATGFSVFVGGHVIVENSPIAGETNRFWALSRLDINGNEDPQFGDGLTVIPENTEGGRINDLALGPSSRVMAVGSVETDDDEAWPGRHRGDQQHYW